MRKPYVGVAVVLSACAAAAGQNVQVLGKETVWRSYWRIAPSLMGAEGKYKPATMGGSQVSAPPAADWMKAEFDDSGWAFRPAVTGGGRSDGRALAMACARARFEVLDPARAKGLTVSVEYRGGVAVYLNGEEIARKDIAAGAIAPETMAADYPMEAFVKEDGHPLPPPQEAKGQWADRYALRERKFTAAVPAGKLRKGVNVLAVQVIRSAYRPEPLGFHWHGEVGRTIWGPCALKAAALEAASADGLAPAAAQAQVWTAPPMTMVGVHATQGDPLAPAAALAMGGPRGGMAAGMVVVLAPAPLKGVTATAGELKGPGGAAIAAAAVEVRYACRIDQGQPNPYDMLTAAPPAEGDKLLLIWATVNVPRDAKPGKYSGALTVRGLDKPVTVPVELTVHDWLLPDVRQWRTWTALIQSPETLAVQYNVPLWSQRHFELMGKSLELNARLSPKVAYVSIVANNWLGREAMAAFRNEGGRFAPVLESVEKYLKLWDKHCGQPKYLLLQVWDAGVEKRFGGSLPIAELKDGKLQAGKAPMFGEAGSEEMWSATLTGVRKIVAALGWREKCLTLGTFQDDVATKKTAEFFGKVAPDVSWVSYTHGSMPPPPLKRSMLISPDQGGGHSQPGWLTPRGYENLTNHRGSLVEQSALPNYRQAALCALLNGFNGFGGFGLDYWTVAEAQGRKGCRFGNDGAWYRLIRGAVRQVLAPGPDGPLPTVRYDVLRLGLQEAEAYIAVQEAAASGKLPPELAARCKALRGRVEGKIAAMLFEGSDCDWATERDLIYTTAGEVEKASPKGKP